MREDVLSSMRAEEDALHAKNRTKPPEAYLPHTYRVLEAVRPAQGDVLPAGIRALVKQCDEVGVWYALSKTLATDTDGFGRTRHVESVSFVASVNRVPYVRQDVFVAYESKPVRELEPVLIQLGGTACFTAEVCVLRERLTFARALLSGRGKGTLTDAKRALGIVVAERKSRAPKNPQTVKKPVGKADTLR